MCASVSLCEESFVFQRYVVVLASLKLAWWTFSSLERCLWLNMALKAICCNVINSFGILAGFTEMVSGILPAGSADYCCSSCDSVNHGGGGGAGGEGEGERERIHVPCTHVDCLLYPLLNGFCSEEKESVDNSLTAQV